MKDSESITCDSNSIDTLITTIDLQTIEIVSDIDFDKFESFIDYMIECEREERTQPMQGYFCGDLLHIDITASRESFMGTDFDVFYDAFITWYKEKISEFFDVDDVELEIIDD